MTLKYSPQMTIAILEALAAGKSMGTVVIGRFPLPTAEEISEAQNALRQLKQLGLYTPVAKQGADQ